jgi:hypothetical protein
MKKKLINLLIVFLLLIMPLYAWSEEETQKEYEWLIPPKYESGIGFSDGLWCVTKDGICGYVDSADNVVIDFQYFEATQFIDGIAFVRPSDTDPEVWGVIDKQGQYIIKPELALDTSWLYHKESRSSGLIRFRAEGKYGFVNLSGDIQIPATYRNADNFSEGMAAVQVDRKWGFIDTQGNFVIPPQYRRGGYFYRGYASFRADNDLYGLIDTNGNVVLEPKYEKLRRDMKGLMRVYVNGKWGFMNDTFHIVVEPIYDYLVQGAVYRGGLVFMQNKETNEGIAFDEQGRVAFAFSTLSMIPDVLGNDAEGYYVMETPGTRHSKQFIINKKGEVILSPGFEYIIPSEEGIIKVTENRLAGLIILNEKYIPRTSNLSYDSFR